jgi:phage nucleotide-binding protein
MFKIKKTSEITSKRFTALIVGESGVGKTSLIKTLPEPQSKILIVSAEDGLLCLKGSDIDVFDVDAEKPIDSLGILWTELQKQESKKKYSYIYIDSITEIANLLLTELKKDPYYGQKANALQMWGKLSERIVEFVKAFHRMSDYSVIFTCLNKHEKNGLEMVEVLDIPGGASDKMKPIFDLVLAYRIFTEENGDKHRKLVTDFAESRLAKDRSGALDAYENADLSVIINKVLGA